MLAAFDPEPTAEKQEYANPLPAPSLSLFLSPRTCGSRGPLAHRLVICTGWKKTISLPGARAHTCSRLAARDREREIASIIIDLTSSRASGVDREKASRQAASAELAQSYPKVCANALQSRRRIRNSGFRVTSLSLSRANFRCAAPSINKGTCRASESTRRPPVPRQPD